MAVDLQHVCSFIFTLPLRLRCAARDERGDISAYLAQGILALATLSLAGVVLFAFTAVGDKLKSIVEAWVNMPISQP